MTGRGAWNIKGLGGTKNYKSNTPGPYYYLGTGDPNSNDLNTRAVTGAVVVYQTAYNRRTHGKQKPLVCDGIFGPVTSKAIYDWQAQHEAVVGPAWGGIGPETSEALLRPDLVTVVKGASNPLVTVNIVSGSVRTESLFDVGAVGAQDEHDIGLAQINGPSHPDLSFAQRLNPQVAFQFVVDYYENSLAQLHNNLRDAIASYNLGIGGARKWIHAGRPAKWAPTLGAQQRDVKGYIDKILSG